MRARSMAMLAAVCLAAAAAPLVAQGDTVSSASGAVKEYIRAASDSNLTRDGAALRHRQGTTPSALKLPDLREADGGDPAIAPTDPGPDPRRGPAGACGRADRDHRDRARRLQGGDSGAGGRTGKDDGWLVRNLDLAKVQSLQQPCQSDGGGNSAPVAGRSCVPAAYSVSSISVPSVALGWTKAIRRPPAPVRGVVDEGVAAGAAGGQGGVEVGDAVADVVDAGAAPGEEAADRENRDRAGSSSSTADPSKSRCRMRAPSTNSGARRFDAEDVAVEGQGGVEVR